MPLSDIVACDQDQLLDIVTQEEAYSKGAWFYAKNIDMIVLSKLGEMLGVAAYDELMEGFELVGEPLDDGPWPHTLPEALLAKLAKITDAEIDEVVPRWAKIEEFHGGWEEGLREYLSGLRTFLAANRGPYFLVLGL
jgi:hypothetical protein